MQAAAEDGWICFTLHSLGEACCCVCVTTGATRGHRKRRGASGGRSYVVCGELERLTLTLQCTGSVATELTGLGGQIFFLCRATCYLML